MSLLANPPPRPTIGLCAAWEPARWSFWNQEAAIVPGTYVGAILIASAVPLGLIPFETTNADVDAITSRIDGLMIIGGADVDPATFGEDRSDRLENTVAIRDAFEIVLARAALEVGLPVLGICRGLQILNVAAGGTLHQHLKDVGYLNHRTAPGRLDAPSMHEVSLSPGSHAASASGTHRELVNSHHHQGVNALGQGACVTARSIPDGVVEALEWPDHPFALGVQWHPEAMELSRTIATFVEAAATTSALPHRAGRAEV